MDYIRPVDKEWDAEIEVKRSRFIGIAKRAVTEDEARAFIDEVRARYPDARHHCSGYLIYQEDAQPIERSSDDGEPAGTAGQPILEVIKGSGAYDLAVVVVRYFGGTLLGTGGLVRAYQDSTKDVLAKLDWVRREELTLSTISLNHADAGRFESEIRNAGYQVLDTEYGKDVTLTVAADERLESLLASLSGGQVEAESAGTRWIDIPVKHTIG